MKLLKFILFLPALLFSFELEFSKRFHHELTHDVLRTHLIITISDYTEKEVDKRLNEFNELIKGYDKVNKHLGTFNIRPRFRHSSNTPVIKGYIGELIYKVESDKALYMDEFITKITELKKYRDTKVSISNLSWTVKDDTYNVIMDLLRLQAINWVDTYSKNLENDINKKCTIKNVAIDGSNIKPLNTVQLTEERKDSGSVTVPQANQEVIEIYPKFILECK